MSLVLIASVLDKVGLVWAIAALVLRMAKSWDWDPDSRLVRAARAVYHELRPFYRPIVVAVFVLKFVSSPVPAAHIIVLFLDLMLWFVFRDEGDDDRWKRRRRKAAGKVKALTGRLVVVPAGAPA